MKELKDHKTSSNYAPGLARMGANIKARTHSFLITELEKTAQACGMSKADFILARTFGLRPRLAFTERQAMGIRNLIDCRTDLVNFSAAFKKMSPEARRIVEKYVGQIGIWLSINKTIAERLKMWSDEIVASDSLPRHKSLTGVVFVPSTYDIETAKQHKRAGALGEYDAEIYVRVSAHEKSQVQKMATKLGVSESDLMRMRCFGYEPLPRMSQVQEEHLLELPQYREGIMKIAEELKGLTPFARDQKFSDAVFMLRWMQAVNTVSEACKAFLIDCVEKKKTRNRGGNECDNEKVEPGKEQ